ncbi:MAG: hypothetical protein QOH36_1459 [Actinomycetota bacterium]|nr:hypothetical protein [Actinomycetota bacterium]
MLYAFGFDEVGVVVGDLYIVDPDPLPGQAGPEQGVRVEVRTLSRRPLEGGIYSAQPILVGRPLWRADLLEAVDHPGTLDRAHHHPTFDDRWNPCERVFEPELSADPVGWVGRRLSSEYAEVRAGVPEILDAVRRLLDRIRAGELGGAPTSAVAAADADGDGAGVRASWL